MPQPADVSRPQSSAEESFMDLLAETLENVERPARGQFLQKFFRTIAQLELTDEQSLEYWEQILARRSELSQNLGKRISLKTAMVDVFASTNFMRVPILVEYEELKRLQSNASTDPLTGLYNRRLFEEYCEKELNRARRYGQHLTLVILDLHQLKEVNDRYGHMQGDQALQLAASTLRKTIRASDFAFRIGGDEFALLLPQADPEQAAILCRRIRINYEAAMATFKLDVPLSIDFGIAVHPQDGDQKDTLIRLADERLYQHKHENRAQPRVIPLEQRPPRETYAPPVTPRETYIAPVTPRETPPPAPREVPTPSPAPPVTPPAATIPPPKPARGREQRKWERVSLVGTRAYAILGEGAGRTASVLDLSYGGVALQVDRPEELSGLFQAVLHVPILPPVRVSLRKVYTQPLEGGRARVGCAFVS
jgi:diguanylate cyclase (GGDEF)-like protein